MIKISIIGSGYVGLVTGACLSDFGWQVVCVDQNIELIKSLCQGIPPIFEPGLEDMLKKNISNNRLSFTTDMEKAIRESNVIFIAVGTPQKEDGSANLANVFDVAHKIGSFMNEKKIISCKSTVPVGTGQIVKRIIQEELNKRGEQIDFEIVSNPEFLRQGSAIQDFMHADRVIIGAETDDALDILKELYRVLYINETPFLTVNIETAELIKYASNAFLATKISFVNELSELCEKVGANIQQVAKGMGMDGRIGSKFLHVGPGYGGSCFPKDTKALMHIGQANECHLGIVQATILVNEKQKQRLVKKILTELKSVEGKVFGILGLAFKNNTDDMREAPVLTILMELSKKGASFKVYDPKAMHNAKRLFEQTGIPVLKYCRDEYEATEDADAVILMTEWNQFRSLNLEMIKQQMKGDFFFDFRNIYSKETLIQKGFKYVSIGRN